MKAATLQPVVISDADFLKFREFFYRRTGIHFDEGKRYFVDKRLVERIEATGAEDFRSYFIALRFEARGEELQHLINLMTVNETYFFREAYQFDCLVNDLMDEVAGRLCSRSARSASCPRPTSTSTSPGAARTSGRSSAS
jgi:chemotaxis protein methyltransferase CheR